MTNKSYLEPQDIGCLIDAADNLRDKLLATALFHLGCRISEALGITVGDIDFDSRTVTIKHLKSRIKLKCPKCDTALCLAAVFCPKCGDKVEAAVKEQKSIEGNACYRWTTNSLPYSENISPKVAWSVVTGKAYFSESTGTGHGSLLGLSPRKLGCRGSSTTNQVKFITFHRTSLGTHSRCTQLNTTTPATA